MGKPVRLFLCRYIIMVTVCCVLWGDKFSDDYVHHLKAGVERNSTVPYNFVCYSDRQIEGVKVIPLKQGLDGWWNKLQLFDGRVQGRIVYLDLDTLITNNIDWLLEYDGGFAGIEDLGAINSHQQFLKGKLQSAVMSWNSEEMTWVYNEFMFLCAKVTSSFRGDGEYLEMAIGKFNRVFFQDKYPNQIKSYKYQVYPKNIEGSSIICFHGRPSIIQAMSETINTPMKNYDPQKWISDYWRI